MEFPKQPTIIIFTIEAKYMNLTQCTKEARWLRHFMSDVGLKQKKVTPIMCDNQKAIVFMQIFSNILETNIDNQHHFICEKVEKDVIEM